MGRTCFPSRAILGLALGLFALLSLVAATSTAASLPPSPLAAHLALADEGESSLSSTVTPTPTPPLRLTVDDYPDPVAAGASIDYAITVRVLDTVAYDSVYVAATPPAGTLFISASDGGVRNADGTVSWQLGTMAGGASKSLSLVMRTSVTAAPGYVYEATFQLSYRCAPWSYVGETIRMCMQEVTVRTTVQTPDQVPRTPTPTVVLCRPDEAGYTFNTAAPITLGVAKRAAICPAGDGDIYSFPANVGDIIDVLVNDMSADVNVYLYRPDYGQTTAGRNAGTADEHLVYTVPSGNGGTWYVQIIAADADRGMADYSVTVRVSAPTPTRTVTRTPTRTATGTTSPTRTATQTSTPAVLLDAETWLESTCPKAGDIIVYGVHPGVTSWSAYVQDVHVRDALPDRTEFISSTIDNAIYSSELHRLDWDYPYLAGWKPWHIGRIYVRVKDGVRSGDTLWNQLVVTGAGSLTARGETKDVVPAPEFDLDSYEATSPVIAGQNMVIKAEVENTGCVRAHDVTLTASLTRDLEYISSSGTYSQTPNTVVWDLGSIASDAARRTFSLTVRPAAHLQPGARLTMRWTLRAYGMSPLNEDETIIIDQSSPPNVSLSWDVSDDTLSPGDSFDLTTHIRQNSAYDLLAMSLNLDLPTGIYLTSTPSGCSVRETGGAYVSVVCPQTGKIGTYTQTFHLRTHAGVASGRVDIPIRVEAAQLPSAVADFATVTIVPDLRIDGLEITQSIQRYPENDVVLIEGRKTWVRVYALADADMVRNVRCVLWVWLDNGEFHEIYPVAGSDYQTVRSSLDRADGTRSFIFGLPQEWARGYVRFQAKVNYDAAVRESDYANNLSNLLGRTFRPGTTDGLAYVLGVYVDANNHKLLSNGGDLDDDLEKMRGMLPFVDVVNLGPAPAPMLVLSHYDWMTYTGWCEAIYHLKDVHDECEGDPLCNERWVLLLPRIPGAAYGGLGEQPGRNIMVIGSLADVAAHESGHNYGLGHADCGLPPSDQWMDPNIPVYIEDYGLDVETLRIYAPGTTPEFMSYCVNDWISIYSYEYIYHHFMGAPALDAPPDLSAVNPALLVAGTINEAADKGVIRRGDLRLRLGGPFSSAGAGPYSLELQDINGVALFTRSFTPTSIAVQGTYTTPIAPTYSFSEILPPQPGTASIVLKHGSTVLDTRLVSANPPTVTLLAPNGGEVITDTFEAQWTASDPDGDALTFMLQYSRNGGQTWLPVAIDVTGTTYILDAASLPGSGQARLRVIANDGVRSGVDMSDADFTVPNHRPELRIIRPEDGERSRLGDIVFLRAEAWDREDQGIGEQVQWRSNRDGVIGVGREVATRTLSVGMHVITAIVTDTRGLTATDRISLTILPPIPSPDQCTERLRNGSFEQEGWGGWAHGGYPAPAIIESPVLTGNHVLLLGNAGNADRAGLSWVRHMIALPTETVHAELTFHYQVNSRDRGGDTDYFLAAITGADEQPIRPIRLHGGQTGWMTVTVDLSEYTDQTIGLLFAVHNDGQGGDTWAYVDDVSLCVSAPPPVEMELDGAWLSGRLPDYAPSGLPDFDQRWWGWVVSGTTQWSHDGPVAAADILWWLDSRAETNTTPPPVVSDTHRLVESVEGDDHSRATVPALVRELAVRMDTNGHSGGTDLDNLVKGLAGYIASKGLGQDYTVSLRHSPSFDWVREEVRQQRPVVLLLGFWELQPGGWKRLGGHYVAVAGAGTGDEEWIALSDPLRDAAEMGLPGRVLPVAGHTHPADPPDATHNDAVNVSHDIYGILRTAAGWGPQGYALTYGSIDNFAGLNFSPVLEQARAGAYLGGEIITVVDDAIVLAPASPSVVLRLSPTINRVLTGEVFQVELDLHAGRQAVDTVHAYLTFDPDKLRVVDANGDPTNQITPGRVLTTVLTNTVNNATGRISFAAQGPAHDGRFVVGVITFRAISTALASPITFVVTGTQTTDARYEGESVLVHTGGARVNILPGAHIVGHAEMQRATPAPDASWQVPVLLTLSRAGERGSAYAFAAMTGPTGTFVIPAVVKPDTYRVRLEGLHTLRNLLLRRTLTPGVNAIDMSMLLEGDALNDNRVDLRDVSLLARAWGKSQGQAGFDPRADFNEDDVIGAADLALLRPNLGRRGDVLVGISPSAHGDVADMTLTAALQATGPVSLGLVPSNTQGTVGQVIALDIVARTGSQVVDAVNIALDYYPAAMTVVDAAGQVTTTIVAGTALPLVLRNEVDLGRGYVDFMATSLGGQPVSGDVVLARVRLKLLAAGSHTVRFSLSGWRETDVVYQGESVLGRVEAASVRVTTGAAFAIYLPVIMKP